MIANVLIVDDSKTICRINSQICSGLGIENIYTALDGQEGLSLLLSKDIDLVLLDVNMPIMNGFQFLEKTLEYRKKNNIKVFMCTTEGGREEVITALRLGANNYIVKPIQRDVLETKIKEVI